MRINEKQNQSEVATSLRQYMESRKVSQATVAKALGISAPAISSYLAGTYKGDVVGVEGKIRQYLSLEESRRESPVLQGRLVETLAFREITEALRQTVVELDMSVITGESGVGKTTAVKEYARTHSADILIETDPGYNSRDLFVELCDRLSLPTGGSLHDLLQRAVDKLRDSGRLIIVDEAEYLPYRALEMLRRVHDMARIPIVLVGMPRLKRNLQGDKNNFAQLWRRVGFQHAVSVLTSTDADAMIRARMGEQPVEIVEALRRTSDSNARVLAKLINWCIKLSRMHNTPVDLTVVANASEYVTLA